MKKDIVIIIPELFLICTTMVLLMAGVFRKSHNGSNGNMAYLTNWAVMVLLFAAILLIQLKGSGTISVLNGMFLHDNFAIFTKLVIIIASILILLISRDFNDNRIKLPFEYPVILLISVTGMMVMVSANNLLALYMGLETQSLALYIMAAASRDSDRSSEAGLKYFMLGSLASGILLFGCSMIYGFSGTLNFPEIAEYISASHNIIRDNPGLIVGMILVITGLCFKISAVPFHMWTPDVYEGSPKITTAFFATAPKIAAAAVFVRFLSQPFGTLTHNWQQIVIFISIASMILGSFGALRQSNIKRLMAYSSIGHIGFILVGVAAGGSAGVNSVLIYLGLYLAMNIGVFTFIILMRSRDEHVEDIKSLSGFASTNPLSAFFLAALMFSMAGVPPLAGFFGKFYVFMAAVEKGLYSLAVIGVVTSVVAAFYYLRIIKIMYFDNVDMKLEFDPSFSTKIVLGAAAIFNLLFFLYPTPLIEAAKSAAESLF